MKNKKILTLIGSVCLTLVLAALLLPACAKPAVETGAAEIAALQKEVAALEKKVSAAEKEVAKLEAAAPVEAKVYEWRLQHFKGPASFDYPQLEEIANSVKTMSEGRLNITPYPVGALVPTMGMLDSVAQGVIEIGSACPVYWKGVEPAFGAIWSLPFGLGSIELDSYLYFEGGLKEIAQEIYAEQGVYLLGLVTGYSYGSLMSTVPIYNLDDLKGLKVRSFAIFADICRAAGAAVVVVPGEEFYLAISTGVIEAGMWGTPNGFMDLELQEVAKYITQPGWGYPAHNDTFINVDAWNELPDDLKGILHAADVVRGYMFNRYVGTHDGIALKKMEEEWGVTVCRWDDEAIAEARALALPFWDDLAAESPYAAEVIGLYKDFMKEEGLL